MPDIVHQRENNDDTERHLQENIGKFETDAQFLLKQMLRGEVLSAKDVVQKYGIADRRLRDLFIDGKCKRRWKLNEAGKRLFVEYYIEIPKLPTKADVFANWNNLKQKDLFD